MRKISQKVRKEVLQRPQICARCDEGVCNGRITWEHAIIYAGKQLDEAWAIVLLCAYHHAVDEYQDCGDLDKEINVWVALNQATDKELQSVSKVVNYIHMREYLNNKYGIYNIER